MKKFLFLLYFITAIVSLPAEIKVLVFAGSTRAESFNKKLATEAAAILKELGATVTFCQLNDYPMPFYDADLERTQGMPKNAKRFRDLMISHDAIVIAAAEYNHSISAVLKNTLDWASRDEKGQGSKEAFKGKKFAIMSASPGKKGGANGLVHLRTILEDLKADTLELQVTIPRANEYYAQENRPETSFLREELQELLGPVVN